MRNGFFVVLAMFLVCVSANAKGKFANVGDKSLLENARHQVRHWALGKNGNVLSAMRFGFNPDGTWITQVAVLVRIGPLGFAHTRREAVAATRCV